MSIEELEKDYSEEQIEKACDALRDRFDSDKEFLKNFLRFNKSNQLLKEIENNVFKLELSEIDDLSSDEIKELFDFCFVNMCEQIDFDFIKDQLEKTKKESLTEAEEDNIEFTDESEAEATPEEDVEPDAANEDPKLVNDSFKKNISFPVVIESDEDVPIEFKYKKDYASKYGDAVVENMNENKKFILSALDIYDFEIFYKSLDYNQYVTFVVTLNDEIQNDALLNIIKRYFNVELDNYTDNGLNLQLNPVLETKFVRVN